MPGLAGWRLVAHEPTREDAEYWTERRREPGLLRKLAMRSRLR